MYFEQVLDEVHILFADKCQGFLQVNTTILKGMVKNAHITNQIAEFLKGQIFTCTKARQS